ncbi:uncharacterized protein LTHEOB_12667 [Lasiodiplodia theobromae]|uniref:uncharacterized protein n=1 Tax=Lasiodiplodia theobromae TaxID=45133 RepID=UPI0015C3C3FF|nr:uncharacterized protein LTHEOB_12667 [Lasiodiplodia theobromae]KAF4535235.1 hypothetical protein LTHEOB_12667 [Lasiodiplodia theobromae]
MATPNQSPPATAAAKQPRVSDESAETTPLLGSPLPPPAYPSIIPHDDDNKDAGPSRNQADYDLGPSKDLENAGIHPAAVHLHHRPARPWSQGKVVRLLLIAAAHAVLIWLILTATWGGRSSKKSNVHNDLPYSETPHMPYYCHELSRSHTTTHSFDEQLDELRIVEQIRQHRDGYHDIHGLIKLVPASDDSSSSDGIRVTVSIQSNFPDDDDIAIVKTDTSLILQSTRAESPNTWHERACTVVDVTVAVPAGTTLAALAVSANWLSLHLHPLLDLTIADGFNVELGAGSVASAVALPSRRTYISPAYGSVQGVYALLDLLEIDAAAGSVDIEVRPGEADPENPAPAVFNARSKAGSIAARFPTNEEEDDGAGLPDRDYQVDVQTEAGSIMGRYVHGSRSSFESKYGSITVTALPFKPAEASVLRAKNEAGQTMLDLLVPLKEKEGKGRKEEEGGPFVDLTAEFTSTVGSVRAVFPPEWEGTADVDTAVGSLRVAGEGLEIVKEGTHGPVGKWVQAVKGEGESTVLIKSKVGSVEFLVQETV